jgi:hypothetical protein
MVRDSCFRVFVMRSVPGVLPIFRRTPQIILDHNRKLAITFVKIGNSRYLGKLMTARFFILRSGWNAFRGSFALDSS